MTTRVPPWQRRVLRVVTGAEWIALVTGIVTSLILDSSDPLVYVAALLGAMWVLATTSVPPALISRPLAFDAFSLAGVILAMAALTLTGGVGSPYFLLSITPGIRASALGGLRTGLAASGLSGALLVAVALAQDQNVGTALGLGILYLAVAATVAQIRRILEEVEQRATLAEASTSEASARLHQLEEANALLVSLADIAAESDLSPVAVGTATVNAVAGRFPGSLVTAAIQGENGPILVARHGSSPGTGNVATIPLHTSGKDVGYVRLETPEPIGEPALRALESTLRSVAVAFANAQLLQEITRRAVREERTRLARELHDEIGPSLASLGLSLDVAMIQGADQHELTEHLEQLRSKVGNLVDDVRSTVSDLRAAPRRSLRSTLEELLSTLPDRPLVELDIDERRPIRPSLASDLNGIVGEALRNALNHAEASEIVVRGWIDFDKGFVVVEDDGSGFDAGTVPSGHFGLIGMRERADRSGLALDVKSTATGTRVEVEWGPR